MDFGDDDDIDDETFALVDKIVEEHNAKKALVRNMLAKPCGVNLDRNSENLITH